MGDLIDIETALRKRLGEIEALLLTAEDDGNDRWREELLEEQRAILTKLDGIRRTGP